MGARDRKGTMQYSLISRVLEKVLAKAARKGTMQLVLKDNYALGYLFQGAFYEANLDKKGFALLKEAVAAVNKLSDIPESKEDELSLALELIGESIFTIVATADTLPHASTPDLRSIIECSEFLDGAIPYFANATGYGWKVEERLRKVTSMAITYSIPFALDSMVAKLKEIQESKEEDIASRIFLAVNIKSIASAMHLIPRSEYSKIEYLDDGLSFLSQ